MKNDIYKSSFEGKLAQYYDYIFWNEKNNITAHVDYIEKYIYKHLKNQNSGKSILDVGCGTGVHVREFASRGYKVIGIDISGDMIKSAKDKPFIENTSYRVMDMCTERLSSPVDIAIAMSHVIGYQCDNSSLYNFMLNINRSLNNNGLFAFNFYHAPGLSELEPKEITIKKKDVKITRYSIAKKTLTDNVLELHYKYLIEDDEFTIIDIEERMRYFTIKEIEYILYTTGFKLEEMKSFLTYDSLDEKHWNGFCVARKVKEII